MPPKWDDDYFFAALPNVPEMKGEEAQGDRYGAVVVAPSADGESKEPAGRESEDKAVAAADSDGEATPRRRRRRRRGGRGRGGRGRGGDGGDGGDGGGSAESSSE